VTEAEALKLATHRHYKGGLYRVVGVAKHSESLEPMTLYEHLWPNPPALWVRPKDKFEGRIEDGRLRFTPL
jgi:hypothetical protein